MGSLAAEDSRHTHLTTLDVFNQTHSCCSLVEMLPGNRGSWYQRLLVPGGACGTKSSWYHRLLLVPDAPWYQRLLVPEASDHQTFSIAP
ncbi:unnamed protein product [Boreogadus saida]